MVLNINDIIEFDAWRSKFHIINITETEIICKVYYGNTKPHVNIFNKETFKSFYWKPATVKWY